MTDDKLSSSEADRFRAEVAYWHNAWREQREATGRAWWQGFAQGCSVSQRASKAAAGFLLRALTRER